MPVTFSDIWRQADELVKRDGPQPLVLLGAHEEYSLKALSATRSKGWIKPVLSRLKRYRTTDELTAKIEQVEGAEFIEADNDEELVRKSVEYALQTRGFLMRGRVHVHDMLHTLLLHDIGFTIPQKLLSHIGFFESDKFPRIIMITDGGVNIKPSLEQKASIVKNAVETAEKLNFLGPKVAMLSAVESVYLALEASLDDAVISKISDRGGFGDAIVDGPLSFDVAVLPQVAKEKKVGGEVAGQADILVVNNIETGAGLYKALFLFSNTRSAGLVVGGRCPVVLTSRSQSLDAILNSIAIGLVLNR